MASSFLHEMDEGDDVTQYLFRHEEYEPLSLLVVASRISFFGDASDSRQKRLFIHVLS